MVSVEFVKMVLRYAFSGVMLLLFLSITSNNFEMAELSVWLFLSLMAIGVIVMLLVKKQEDKKEDLEELLESEIKRIKNFPFYLLEFIIGSLSVYYSVTQESTSLKVILLLVGGALLVSAIRSYVNRAKKK